VVERPDLVIVLVSPARFDIEAPEAIGSSTEDSGVIDTRSNPNLPDTAHDVVGAAVEDPADPDPGASLACPHCGAETGLAQRSAVGAC
jgi:hypothetical protein